MNKEGISKRNLIEFGFIFVFAISVVFMINFVMANGYTFWGLNNQSNTLPAINYTNATGITINEDVLQNFSILINSSALRMGIAFNITRINITLPSGVIYSNYSNATGGNISSARVLFTNTSDGKRLSWSNLTDGEQGFIIAGGNASYNNSLIYFNFTVFTPGLYNISVRIFYNGTNPLLTYNETNITIRVNDTTKPFNLNVTTMDGLNASRGANNVSGSLIINVSAYDNGNLLGRNDDVTGVNVTFFNTTHGITTSYMLTNFSQNNWNITIDTTDITDGTYNVSFIVNDSNGNVNRTANISVKVDNTAPIGTMDCNPDDDVFVGGSVSCSCTISDAFSGVNTSRTAYNSTPSTTDSGDVTQTCYFSDFAGNEGTATDLYTIWGSNPSTGSSPGSTSTTPTTTKTTNVGSIVPGTPKVITTLDGTTSVKEITIEVSSTATNVQVTVNKYESAPAAVTVSLENAYKYLQINTQNLADKLSKATMKIHVEKSWVTSEGITKEDVALFKYDETADVWNELTTTYDSEDATYYYYTIEMTSFSYFGIAPRESAVVTGGEETPTPTGEEPQPATGLLGLPIWVWVIIGLVILAAIIGGGVVLGKKKRR